MVFRSFAICGLSLPAFAAALGPTGTLYMTATDGDFLLAVQGRGYRVFATEFAGEGPIVVSRDVRTTGAASGGYGASYGLDGAFSGGLYANDVPSHSSDGAGDGGRNFVVNDQGDVYATGRSFEAPTLLFSAASPANGAGGIAYDPVRRSLWVESGGFLTQYSTAGDVRGAFALAGGGGAVAFDPQDGTLWVGTPFAGDTLLSNYTVSGSLIDSYVLGAGLSVSGMEFAVVPEPASLLALGLGALPLLARRRRLR